MAEPLAFRLPDLGEGLTDAEIVRWHVSAGDRVVADQPLLTVETDKAVVDIPAPHGGRIEALHAAEGEHVEVGEVLLTWAAEGAGVGRPADRGAVVGELPRAEDTAAVAVEAAPAATTAGAPEPARRRISPRARRRARVLGVDIERIAATGPDGTIELEDVEQAAKGVSGEPLFGVRRAMAERMAAAWSRVARASVSGEADISAWPVDTRPMPRLIRALAAAAKAQPRLNARFDDAAMTLELMSQVDLGIAMETADGLFVPVLKDVGGSSPEALATELARLETAVRERSIRPTELSGQTITLSNFGAVAGIHAEMIVVPPQVAIVGAGRIFERSGPAWGAQHILPLSISFDHRVITGVEACEFLLALSNDLELES